METRPTGYLATCVIIRQVDTYEAHYKPGESKLNRVNTARSGLPNPLHMHRNSLDMSIQAERVLELGSVDISS